MRTKKDDCWASELVSICDHTGVISAHTNEM